MSQLLNSAKTSETSLLKGMVLGIAGIITMSERRVWKSGKLKGRVTAGGKEKSQAFS